MLAAQPINKMGSAANKGRSAVNYRQFLVFDRPYLSCNDHCDWWLFQKIFFIIFRSSRTQMFFKTGFIRNFAIFTGKHLCWSLFLIKLQALHKVAGLTAFNFISTSSQKRLQHRCFPVNIAKFLRAVFFIEHLRQSNCSIDLLFLIKNKKCGMVSTRKVCRSGQSMLFTHY